MTRLSVCSLGVSCNEMIDTPMLLVVTANKQCLSRFSQNCKCPKMQYIGHYVISGIELLSSQKYNDRT